MADANLHTSEKPEGQQQDVSSSAPVPVPVSVPEPSSSTLDHTKDMSTAADVPRSEQNKEVDPHKPGVAGETAPADTLPAVTSSTTVDPAVADAQEKAPVSTPPAASSVPQDDTIESSGKQDGAATATRPVNKASRSDSLAIGPSVDSVQLITPVSPADGLVCNITLLLTTGARHPYRIDEKYLSKRGVTVPGKTEEGKQDPFTISVYTLKELILREWRDEWDPKPASPSSIRLIHFGKLLDDKDPLTQYHFSAEAANVVHMTVRPADLIEEEEPKGGSKSASGSRSRSGGGSGGCCVIL